MMLTVGFAGFGGEETFVGTALGEENGADDNGTLEWQTETFEGTIVGASIPGVGSTAPSPPSEGQSFSFQADQDIEILYVNLTTEGGELAMYVAEPGCGFNEGCEEIIDSEDGEAQYFNETPDSGEWHVRFFPQDIVTTGVDYTAEVAQGINVTAQA